MNTQLQNKLKTQICFLLFTAIMAAQLSVFSVAMAAGSVDCAGLNKPEITKDWIVTVIEEQVTTGAASSAAAATDTQVLDCIRATVKCEKDASKTCSSYIPWPGTCPADGTCSRVQVLLAKSGATLLYTYIGLIYRWAAGAIGIVSVLFLVVGGIEITTSGDSNRLDAAKQRIIQSLAGLVLLLLSGVILYTINPNFFQI
jgi:hypothetical protein